VTEQDIVEAVQSLVGGRVFLGVAPEGTILPYLTFMHVGGDGGGLTQTFCGVGEPEMVRIQFNYWGPANDRTAAVPGMRAVRAILLAPPFLGTPEGGIVGRYDPHAKLYGAMQDISFWIS